MNRNRLYKDFDEIMLHCPDNLFDALCLVRTNFIDSFDWDDNAADEDDLTEYRLPQIYARIVGYMEYGHIYDKEYILENFSRHKEDEDYVTQYLPKKYNASEESMILSSVLHVMHTTYPSLREQAMIECAREKNLLMRAAGYSSIIPLHNQVFFDTPEFLDGKDAFPSYLESLVREKLVGMDDIGMEFAVTWGYCHLDNGYDYDYSTCEGAHVTIYSPYPEIVGKAVKILEDITFEEIVEQKIDYETEQWTFGRFKPFHEMAGKYVPVFENGICVDYTGIEAYNCNRWKEHDAIMMKRNGIATWPMMTVQYKDTADKPYALYVNSEYYAREHELDKDALRVMSYQELAEYEQQYGKKCGFGKSPYCEYYIRFAFDSAEDMYKKKDELMETVAMNVETWEEHRIPREFDKWGYGMKMGKDGHPMNMEKDAYTDCGNEGCDELKERNDELDEIGLCKCDDIEL